MAERVTPIVAIEQIENRIFLIRGQKVMLGADLAALCGVTTKRFNEQVRRNLVRFPADFMFQLKNHEAAILRSQFAISSSWGGRRHLPYVFTAHGTIMAATILNTPQAAELSVYMVRVFVRMRELASTDNELAAKLASLEARLEHRFNAHDEAIAEILDAIRQLMVPPPQPKKQSIGLVTQQER